MRARSLAVGIVLLCLAGWPAHADWGADLEPGNGPKLIEAVQIDLERILVAEPGRKPERIQSFLKRGGRQTIESTKRFRNPELKDLFLAVLHHTDWHLQHRALLALDRYGGPEVLERALALLDHPERRLREKAILTCIRHWDGRPAPTDLAQRRRAERNWYLRRALDALAARAAGTLTVVTVHEEYVAQAENGLRHVPFLDGWATREEAAPGWATPSREDAGSKGADRLPPAPRWVGPVLGFQEEEVPGAALEPFGNLAAAGNVQHPGLDLAACIDGAGIYAPAAGIVRAIRTGFGYGTEIAVEHSLGSGRLVTFLVLHAGDVVFVRPGDAVEAGQLLGVVGLSYSLENGGRHAHVHVGLHAGRYDPARMIATLPADADLGSWIDPAEFFTVWMERTRPIVEELPLMSPDLLGVHEDIERGQYARAWREASRLESSGGTDDLRQFAGDLAYAVAQAPSRGVRRARRLVEGGYPKAALALLRSLTSACRGVPGQEAIEEQLDEWKDDDGFQEGLKGEAKLAAAEKKALKEKNPAKRRALWKKMEDAYGDTVLGERIREQMESAD